jgi:hypothetical protein
MRANNTVSSSHQAVNGIVVWTRITVSTGGTCAPLMTPNSRYIVSSTAITKTTGDKDTSEKVVLYMEEFDDCATHVQYLREEWANRSFRP